MRNKATYSLSEVIQCMNPPTIMIQNQMLHTLAFTWLCQYSNTCDAIASYLYVNRRCIIVIGEESILKIHVQRCNYTRLSSPLAFRGTSGLA